MENTPSMEQLEEWMYEMHSEAQCECDELTEVDGQCSHGNDSWFLVLGLV